jgi:hypothetical protein
MKHSHSNYAAENDNSGELIGKVIKGTQGLRFKIVGFGRRNNTVRIKAEHNGHELDLNVEEARILTSG